MVYDGDALSTILKNTKAVKSKQILLTRYEFNTPAIAPQITVTQDTIARVVRDPYKMTRKVALLQNL